MKEDLAVFRAIREKANSGLYRYRSRQSIDSIYSSAFEKVKTELSITDFYKILLVLTDFEGSNHNGTSLPYKPAALMQKDRGYFPFFLKHVDGKMLVNNSNVEIPLGSQLVSINGISDQELQKRFYKYLTTDGYNMTAKTRASIENVFGWIFPFEMGVSEFFDIEYKAHGSEQIQKIQLKSISQEENRNRYFARHSAKLDSITDSNVQEKYSFQRINENTALLNFRIFTMASNAEDPDFAVFSSYLDSVFSLVKSEKITNLIVDIRNNPGGNDPTYEKVFTYLTTQTFKENKEAFILFNKLPYPQYFKSESEDKGNRKQGLNATNSYLQEIFSVKKENRFFQNQSHNPPYYPDSNRFTGKLYLVIDENVGSAASHFASLVRGHSPATIVGMETSGGYYGHNGHFPVEYVLPNSQITTRFSIVHVEQDAPVRADQPVGRGIIPDYRVLLSFEDFMKNEDSQMKFVLKLIEGIK
ncbi:S41 family peptidase [Fluviicola sp.]|uniref:S41 family peptidase n=1 Tax=Fluviicola sp. TaxID=1917219 RepID=UPI002628060F|nr:S41 family peptidase [Fluviicola sp.]